jgi:hypothetical protein
LNRGVTRVISLLLLLLLACHWVGCLWWLVSNTELAQGITSPWHPEPAVVAGEFGLQYAHAFLWGASICTGFILYDVMPTTISQVIATAFGLFVGLFISVVMTSTTTAALHAVDAKSTLGRERLERLEAYLSLKRVPRELTSRIVEFFNYQMTSTKSVLKLEELESLPYQLQMMLFIQLHKGLITTCPIFQPLPESAILSLLRRLKPEVYPPDTLLIQEGVQNRELFIVSRGVLNVWKSFSSDEREHVATLHKNDFFGEQSLLKDDQLAAATVQTVSFCDMLVLSGADFDEVLRQYVKNTQVFSKSKVEARPRTELKAATAAELSPAPASATHAGGESVARRQCSPGTPVASGSVVAEPLTASKPPYVLLSRRASSSRITGRGTFDA